MAIIRQILTLGASAALSWWVVFGWELSHSTSIEPGSEPQPVVLTPMALEVPEPETTGEVEPSPEASESVDSAPNPLLDVAEQNTEEPPRIVAQDQSELAPETTPVPPPEPSPPPSELGAPDGEGDVAAAEAPSSETPEESIAASDRMTVEEAMVNESLLAAATSELAGDVRSGFATVLLASPEEQLELARFFGEELVLVPKNALSGDSATARYYRIALAGEPRVEPADGLALLERYRQYRDLFDYEYARLPKPLRELRRKVPARDDVYLFAALIPAREWAVVVQRRREALENSGRDADDAHRFVLRYRARVQGGFDVVVEEIAFVDGSRFRSENTTTNQ